jgi:hypothetical protein
VAAHELGVIPRFSPALSPLTAVQVSPDLLSAHQLRRHRILMCRPSVPAREQSRTGTR